MRSSNWVAGRFVGMGLVLGGSLLMGAYSGPCLAAETAAAGTAATAAETTTAASGTTAADALRATTTPMMATRLATVDKLEKAGDKVGVLVELVKALDFAAENCPTEYQVVEERAKQASRVIDDIFRDTALHRALDTQLPTWDAMKTPYGRILLVKYNAERIRFSKTNGDTAGVAQYAAICQDLAWRMITQYPKTVAARDAVEPFLKASEALGEAEGAAAKRQLFEFVQKNPATMIAYRVGLEAMKQASNSADAAALKAASEQMTAAWERGGLDDAMNDQCWPTFRRADMEYNLALAYSSSGRAAQALERCESIQATYGSLEQKGDDKAEPNIILQNNAYLRTCLVAQSDYSHPEKALAAYDAFLTRYPSTPLAAKVLVNKGQVHMNRGERAQAMRCLDQAIAIDAYSEDGLEATARRRDYQQRSEGPAGPERH